MSDLVTINGQQVVTSSRNVAEHFEKEHRNVIQSIENLFKTADKKDVLKIQQMFFEATEPDSYGREQKIYYMNWKGFSLLVMGFTGAKALSWKLKYTEAFEEMQKRLSVPQLEHMPRYQTRLLATAVRDIGKTSESIETMFAVKHSMALSAAMELVEKTYGFDASPLKKLLPAEENPGYLTATMIAEKLGFLFKNGKPNGGSANAKLAALGLQKKESKAWRLTDKGREYGEEKPFTRNGHSDYRIHWNEKVIDLLRKEA